MPCGCGCSRAELAAGECRRSAALRGTTPGETEGWGQGSWKEVCGPKPSTSAAAGTGWPGGGPGLLPLRPGVKASGLNATLMLLELKDKRYSPAAACWCCWCWTGLVAGWLGGPPCCGGPPCWAWPVGVAEGCGCCGCGCRVALGCGYC